MKSLIVIFLCLCVNFSVIAYKAGAIHDASDVSEFIYETGRKELDILVLPEIKGSENNYDETVKNLSKAAKEANAYIVAHLKEKVRCQNKLELIRSNLVFDRQGIIVSDYRKPINQVANCTAPTRDLTSFTTDFGVKFGLMMEEDVVLRSDLEGLKNFVVTGHWATDLKVYGGPQFLSSWAHVNKVNVITTHGIYPAGLNNNGIIVAELQEDGHETTNPPITDISSTKAPIEDLNLYIIRPLDVEASVHGYRETVCHNGFCCEFYIKSNLKDTKSEAHYGVGVFNGVRHYGGNQYIGEQNCGVFACAGLYKRTCDYGSINDNSVKFEKLSIHANFTKTSTPYPVVLANGLSADSLHFHTETSSNIQQTAVKLTDAANLIKFGIYGRNFENDYESFANQNRDGVSVYDYIFNEDVLEVFDYLWIRIRILLFVVSIYVLEML